MILSCCLHCQFHEKVEIECRSFSRCVKENCLSIYFDCVINTAVKSFISQNSTEGGKEASSALEICYPLA